MPNPMDTSQAKAGLYPNGQPIANEYEFDPGVCILPVAEDPASSPSWSPVVVCRLHAPFRTRRVKYRAEKSNNPPVMPAPESAGKFVFVGGSMGVTTTLNTTFVNYDWQVETDYVFVENCVSRTADGFVLGSPGFPWAVTGANLAQFGSTQPPTGSAAAAANVSVWSGYAMSNSMFSGGTLNDAWGYNEPSYYPGAFFNTVIVNGAQSA